jgi:Na+/H+-dicarboxylate symporter
MGIAISAAGEEGKFLLKLFQSITDVMMKVTSWVVCCSPVGVLFIVAGQVVERGDPKELEKLAMYFVTVMAGITIHGFIVLPLIYAAVTRSLPFRFIGNMVEALMTAWGTASSTATLPVTIKCLEQKNNINPIITRFVLPIGATINMDGTALYEAVAAIFISQMSGEEMSPGRKVAVFITAMAGSIGAAGIPQGGLVTLAMVLEAAGLSTDSLGLILSVDWLLDRFQTSMNVLGDSIGAAIVSHCSKKDLEAFEKARKNIDMA